MEVILPFRNGRKQASPVAGGVGFFIFANIPQSVPCSNWTMGMSGGWDHGFQAITKGKCDSPLSMLRNPVVSRIDDLPHELIIRPMPLVYIVESAGNGV
jgi:hypothetical protein